MELLRLTIPGPPRTKKNSPRVVSTGGFAKVLPSAAWEAWLDQIKTWIKRTQVAKCLPMISVPVNCAALFYRERAIGDADGYYHGLADVLESIGAVENDRLIVSWDGSRLRKDSRNPRVELVLTMVDADEVAAMTSDGSKRKRQRKVMFERPRRSRRARPIDSKRRSYAY